MVATRGQGRKRAAQEEQEPPITEYERSRDRRVADNNKKMQELGLKTLSSAFNNSIPESTSKKGKKSATKKSNSEGSDTSEYLLDDEDQGDSDDDDTESEEQPQPLAVKLPSGRTRKFLASKRKKNRRPDMAPGSWVRKRVTIADPEASVIPPPPQTRSKRPHPSETDGQNVQEQVAQNSYTAAGEEADGHDEAGFEYSSATAADNVHGEEDIEAAAHRAPRRPRPPTKGTHLERMTKAMGRRLPIVVAEGNRRPHDPVQAAKFASESGVVVRNTVPVLPHWKDYKRKKNIKDSFVGELCNRLLFDKEHKPTDEACTDMLRSTVKQQRYRLKKKYFDGVPANEIRTTSPVSTMSDEQWRALVAKWTDPKNMATCEKNKQNRSRVKYHQATGSRSYVAHLHHFKQTRNNAEPSHEHNEELDAVEAFVTCHTSSKKGLSEPAREAVAAMETLRADPADEGQTPVCSVDVVSKALSQTSSHLFLKSVGIKIGGASKSSSANQSEIWEELTAEARAAVQDELDILKQRSQAAEEQLARTQRELQEYKQITEKNTKKMEETNQLVKALLSINARPSTSN